MDMSGIEDLMANSVLVQAKNNGANCEKYRKNFKLPDSTVLDEVKSKVQQELADITPEDVSKDEKKLANFHFFQLCDKQPIGKRMFETFCKSAETQIKHAMSLVDAIRNYEISVAEEKKQKATVVVNGHLVPKAPFEVQCLPEEIKAACAKIVLSESAPKQEDIKEILKTIEEKTLEPINNDDNSKSAEQQLIILSEMSDTDQWHGVIKLLFDECKAHTTAYFVEEVFSKYKNSKEYETFLRWKHKEKEPVVEEDFLPLRILGRGGFGEVYAYQVKCTGKLYACKKTCKKRMKQKHGEKIVHMEKMTLQGVNSPFIVNLAYAYDNKNYLNLVMTLMGSGDLKFHIYEADKKNRGLTPERTKFYTAQITLGMDHLHSVNILYRDLKPENVLLDDTGNARIADLGLVCTLTGDSKTSGRAGTIGFMAPEMLKNEEYAYGVDWFALGSTIYEMVEGRNPFFVKNQNTKKLCMESTVKKTIEEKHSYKRSHSSSLVDIIDRLLEKSVKHRLAGDERSANAIKRHPYFSDMNWDRLEAGLIPAPFQPNPNQVYAKDVSDIKQPSEVKGVKLTEEDKEFHETFASGRVPITWQHEVIETGLFDEIMEGKYDKMNDKKNNKKSKICILL